MWLWAMWGRWHDDCDRLGAFSETQAVGSAEQREHLSFTAPAIQHTPRPNFALGSPAGAAPQLVVLHARGRTPTPITLQRFTHAVSVSRWSLSAQQLELQSAGTPAPAGQHQHRRAMNASMKPSRPTSLQPAANRAGGQAGSAGPAAETPGSTSAWTNERTNMLQVDAAAGRLALGLCRRWRAPALEPAGGVPACAPAPSMTPCAALRPGSLQGVRRQGLWQGACACGAQGRLPLPLPAVLRGARRQGPRRTRCTRCTRRRSAMARSAPSHQAWPAQLPCARWPQRRPLDPGA
jgi:hypothetical protein